MCEHSWNVFSTVMPGGDLCVTFDNPAACANTFFILGSVLLVSLSMLDVFLARSFTVNLIHSVNMFLLVLKRRLE